MTISTIKNRQEFLNIAKNGKKAVAKGLLLQALPNDANSQQIGFTVSKKVGNAVIRNRVKRRLRAVATKILPELAKSSYSYVIIGRTAALERKFDDLIKDLKYALHSTDTYKKTGEK